MLPSAYNDKHAYEQLQELRILKRLKAQTTKGRLAYTIRLTVNQHALRVKIRGALVDRGANGGIAGSDTSILGRLDSYPRTISLCGIDNHTVRDLRIINAATVTKSHCGPVILILREYCYMPDAKTIHSPLQMEHYGCSIMDKSPTFNNHAIPHILTRDGYKIPMYVEEGLMYFKQRPVQQKDWETLPITYLTSGKQWDPMVGDSTVPDEWYQAGSKSVTKRYLQQPFDGSEDYSSKRGRLNLKLPSPISVNVSSIMTDLKEIVQDEMTHDVIEMHVDGDVYNTDPDNEDDQHEWLAVNESTLICKETQALRRHGSGSETTTTPSTADNENAVRTDSNNQARDTRRDITGLERMQKGPYLGKPSEVDYKKLRRFFAGAPEHVIKKTIQNTTMLGVKTQVNGIHLWKRTKSPNPALNIRRRNETVATDTIYGPVPAIGSGDTAAQFFVGRKSDYVDVEPCGNSDKRYPETLMNHIRKYGIMDVIHSDRAKAQISERVMEICRTLGIRDTQSEPYVKNQNYSERKWRDTKRKTEFTLNNTGAPAYAWLAALQYVCFIENHTASEKLGWRTPFEWLHGFTPDITIILQFMFWEPVYYRVHDERFPDNTERLGRMMGFADTVGNALTYRILTGKGELITRAVLRTAKKDGPYLNLRAIEQAGKIAPKKATHRMQVGDKTVEIHSSNPTPNDELVPTEMSNKGDETEEQPAKPDAATLTDREPGNDPLRLTTAMEEIIEQGGALPEIEIEKIQENLPEITLEDIIGKTFMTTPDDDDQQDRATIYDVEATDEESVDGREMLLRFKAKVGNRKFEEVLTYNQMLKWIEDATIKEGFHQIETLKRHRKAPTGKWEDGSTWELEVLWTNGEITWEPLNTIWEDDGVTVSMYAHANNLLDTPGWKRCKRFTRRKQVIARMVNQAKLRSFRNLPKYKYGVQVPRDHREAVHLDFKNGNTSWADAEKKEITQLMDYESFIDLGLNAPAPDGYKKIPCHFVYDMKHDGRYKGRFVAGGHRTDTPVDSVYSGVVSLQGIRIVTFLAELNKLELWGTDIGNAYLESYTSEKVYFIAGPEFGELEGHTLLISKAQYGLKSSGRCWHDKLHDVLKDMGFQPSKAEEDIWMRDMDDHYEYIAVYVDDLMIASRNPKAIITALENKPNSFKLKGTGPVEFHLGCDFIRDEDGVLCLQPKKYIERMAQTYERLFGSMPSRKASSPLEKGDHPELDDSELLDDGEIKIYQTLIGVLQWTVSLGRFDIAVAVMSMSSYRVAPRRGHLERLKRICGYLYKFKDGSLKVRTGIPDYSDLQRVRYDWTRSAYCNAKEEIPEDAPDAKGPLVRQSSYKDANLMHDVMNGRAVSGILHFLNQFPVDWYAKKQPTVESATYGSEFVAGRTAVQQIKALRITLRYLGVRIEEPSFLFGDNESVVKSSTVPHSLLSKRHHALSYHTVREAIAAGIVEFHHIPGTENPADILSKHWGHAQVYHHLLKPIMFYRGDTLDLIDEPIPEVEQEEEVETTTQTAQPDQD